MTYSRQPDPRWESLSEEDRRTRIEQLRNDGLTLKAISEELHVSVTTIQRYSNKIASSLTRAGKQIRMPATDSKEDQLHEIVNKLNAMMQMMPGWAIVAGSFTEAPSGLMVGDLTPRRPI